MTDEKLKFAHLSGIVAARSVKDEDDEDEKVSAARADDDEDAKSKKAKSKAADDDKQDDDDDKKDSRRAKSAKRAKADDDGDDDEDKKDADDDEEMDDDEEDKKDSRKSKKSKARTFRDGVKAERDRCAAIFAGANPSYLQAAAEMAFSTDMSADSVLRVLATFPSQTKQRSSSLAETMSKVKNPEVAPEEEVRFDASNPMAVVDFVRKATSARK